MKIYQFILILVTAIVICLTAPGCSSIKIDSETLNKIVLVESKQTAEDIRGYIEKFSVKGDLKEQLEAIAESLEVVNKALTGSAEVDLKDALETTQLFLSACWPLLQVPYISDDTRVNIEKGLYTTQRVLARIQAYTNVE